MARKLWRILQNNTADASILMKEYQISKLAAQILINRGMYAPYLADRYLLELPPEDPMRWSEMADAVYRIREAIEQGEVITIYGDYDCDGVTSTALLYDCIKSLGGNVNTYLPNRLTEGYGMNEQALFSIAKQGTTLVITVDNGITAVREADLLATLGVDLIITDHHQPERILPSAIAILNPHCKSCKAEYPDWAGVGVSFCLATALLGDADLASERYAELVAIGTIADVVPLTLDNKTMVRRGLKALAHTTSVGLSALLKIAGLDTAAVITEDDIAFRVAPRINAAGRMDSPDLALRLLLTDSPEEAEALAEQLQECNLARRDAETQILNEIEEQIKEDPHILQRRVLVFSGEGWHHGEIGIVSARLTEQYGKPSFVFAEDDGVLTGSGRSLGEFSLFLMLCDASKLLIRFGGHKLAAGASLYAKRLDAFMKCVEEYASTHMKPMPRAWLSCDIEISPNELTVEEISSLQVLRPFGKDNQEPVFYFPKAKITQVYSLSDGKHTKLQCELNDSTFTVLCFGCPYAEFLYRAGAVIDLAVTAHLSEYRGETSVSFYMQDIRPAAFSQKKYMRELNRYEAFVYDTLIPEDYYSMTLNSTQIRMVYAVIKAAARPVSADELYLILSEQKRMKFDTVCLCMDILYEAGIVTGPSAVLSVTLTGEESPQPLHSTDTYQKFSNYLAKEETPE